MPYMFKYFKFFKIPCFLKQHMNHLKGIENLNPMTQKIRLLDKLFVFSHLYQGYFNKSPQKKIFTDKYW